MSAEQTQEAVVKPLEWVATGQTGFLECQYYAVSGPLRHSVHPLSAEDGSFFEHYDIRYSKTDNAWCLIYWVGNNGLSGINDHFPTLETAKAAAQADYEARIRSALVAPAASSQERIAPEGWKLVPVEPTLAMIHAYCEVQNDKGIAAFVNARLIWPAMLAAAPERIAK